MTIIGLRVLVFAAAFLPASLAVANPREQGFLLGFGATGGAVNHGGDCTGCDTGPGFGFHVRGGGLFADGAKFGIVLDGVMMESWHDGGKRFHGAGTLGVSAWPESRLSLSLGAGYAAADTGAGDELVGSGPAVIGTAGWDLRQWRTRALIVRVVLAAADGDDGTATQATVTIGVDMFGIKGSP
jgi:hypothetical protein